MALLTTVRLQVLTDSLIASGSVRVDLYAADESGYPIGGSLAFDSALVVTLPYWYDYYTGPANLVPPTTFTLNATIIDGNKYALVATWPGYSYNQHYARYAGWGNWGDLFENYKFIQSTDGGLNWEFGTFIIWGGITIDSVAYNMDMETHSYFTNLAGSLRIAGIHFQTMAPPGKAQNPIPADAAGDIVLGLIKLEWDAPS